MPKKKKQVKKKDKKQDAEQSAASKTFWRQVNSFILIVAAFFLLIGGFHWGGALPEELYKLTSWCIGWVAYALPFIMVLIAYFKIRDKENIVPKSKLVSGLVLLLGLAAMLQIPAGKNGANSSVNGSYGGAFGSITEKGLHLFLNSITAFIISAVITAIAAMYFVGLTPKQVFKLLKKLMRKSESGDTDLSELKNKDKEPSFQMHEGVPVVHHNGEGKPSPRLSSLKNSASKLTGIEDHAALTAASDPDWKFPGVNLLNQKQDKADPGDVGANAEMIKSTLGEFGIKVEMEGANIGPRVTQYTMKPSSGQKLSKIASYETNIAYELAAEAIRIEAPIPGKRAVGIEVPNYKAATVRVASIVGSKEWSEVKSHLPFAVGKDISGNPVIGSLDKMPHLLIAGQTGSGKSVMINTLLTSLLYRNSPSDLKLILVDPKQVELTPYNAIPHLLTPVITEPEKTISALKWAVAEMERRLRAFAADGMRNIAEYNDFKKEEGIPYIVIVIDELADLMMVAARDVESLIVRIAQKARAAGIHLVLATQRPSVDVITGLIKANVPARIAFTVVSYVDSKTIIDQQGADKLLGMGDMLFMTSDMGKPIRVQGALIDKEEIDKVTDFLRAQRDPQYDDEVVSMPVQLNGKGGVVVDHGASEADDDMWKDAVTVVVESGKASTSLLQRRLRIGYGRASRIIDEMEERGVVGPADGARPREVLVRNVEEVFRSSNEEIDEVISDDPRDELIT